MNKYIAICAAILFIYNGARAEELMTWDDCVKEAAKNHPDLVSAQMSIKSAQADKTITASGLFP